MEHTGREERTEAKDLLTVQQLKDAWLRSEPVQLGDPILAHAPLNRHGIFHPMGFPVSVTTNSQAVLDVAREAWSWFPGEFDRPQVRLNVAVAEDNSRVCPPTPVCRMRGNLVTNIADSDNFATTDLSSLFSTICVTEAAVRHPDYFRYFFLDSTAMSCISSAYATAIHAGCVAMDGEAILLCGDSGAGKTTLSYACARAGWTYVTDDGTYLVHGEADRLVTGNCNQVRFRPSAEALFPQLHGRQVMRRAGVGKPSIELPIDATSDIQRSATAKARYMVFLARNTETQELVPFPRAVARMFLWQSVQCMPYETDRHLRAIDALLDVEIFELRYNSLEWAVNRLKQLLHEGR